MLDRILRMMARVYYTNVFSKNVSSYSNAKLIIPILFYTLTVENNIISCSLSRVEGCTQNVINPICVILRGGQRWRIYDKNISLC